MASSRLLSHPDVQLILCAVLLLFIVYAFVMCTCFGTLSFRKANALFRECQHLEHRYDAMLQKRDDVLQHISGARHVGEHDQVALLEEQLVRVDGELDVIEKRLQDFDERHSGKRLKKM